MKALSEAQFEQNYRLHLKQKRATASHQRKDPAPFVRAAPGLRHAIGVRSRFTCRAGRQISGIGPTMVSSACDPLQAPPSRLATFMRAGGRGDPRLSRQDTRGNTGAAR
jgi:hypothetical protein